MIKKLSFGSKTIIASLVSFLAIFIAINIYLMSIHNKIQNFNHKTKQIDKLILLNRDFNSFATQKGSFTNYDYINKKIKEFDLILNSLYKSLQDDTNYDELLSAIKEIKKDFNKKVSLLEHLKSFNSSISASLSYLSDLAKSIDKISSISKDDKQMIDNTLFLTTQLYANLIQKRDTIDNNLKEIKNISKKVDNVKLNYFYSHINDIIKQLYDIQDEHQRIKELKISSKLEKLHLYSTKRHQKYITIGQLILIFFMISMAVVISYILYLYTKSKRDKIELQAYRYAIENSDNSIVITDKNHNITYVNEAFEKETGYKKEEVLGQNPRILQSGLMDDEHYKSLNQSLDDRKKWKGEFINRHKNGELIYEKASISPIVVDDKITHYIAIKLNVTDYVNQEKRVEFLAYHDQLTSLPNRIHFENYFNKNIVDKNQKATLLFIDLDRFKIINDSLGHTAGDELLKVFAKRVQNAINSDDFFARLGGDEFVIILKNESIKYAKTISKRILNLFATPVEIFGNSLKISASIGVAFFPDDGNSLESLLKHADSAMYDAKNSGRNNFKLFTKELSIKMDERLSIEQALQNAIKNSEFYMVYQPKYEIKTQKTVGFEALIRWENEKLGFVGPDKFIPIAEDIGLIDKIGLFTFERACRDFRVLKEIDPSLDHIAINLSTLQFKEPNFIQSLNYLCKKTGLNPSDIELEITESSIMDNIEQNIKLLQKLREFGYKIAIDDFGTGYSSFGYLKKLPINTIKIDKSFVDDITLNKSDKDIVQAIINLSHDLGFKTVAEGIETKDQESLLLSGHCDLGQGYLFSRPQKLNDIKEFIKEQSIDKQLALVD